LAERQPSKLNVAGSNPVSRSIPSLVAIPGRRVLKTALAVGLAWWLTSTLLAADKPVFAAMGAFVAMEQTIVRSVRRTGLQLVGVAGGAVLAFVGVNVLGIGPVLVALAVLLGLTLGRVVQSDRIGTELSVTALLVVGLADGSLLYGWTRLWETAFGAIVAIVVNTLVMPPDHVGRFRRDFDNLARESVEAIRLAAEIFTSRPNHEGAGELRVRAKAARDTLPDVESGIDLAAEALRFNLLRRQQLEDLGRYRPAVQLFGRAIIHATTLARIIDDHAGSDHPWQHGGLEGPNRLQECADAVSRALEDQRRYALGGEPSVLRVVDADLAEADSAIREFLATADRERDAETDVRRMIDIAAIAAELMHLAGDIRAHTDSEASRMAA
jgi:hypothetical protein